MSYHIMRRVLATHKNKFRTLNTCIVGQGEIAGNRHLVPFPLYFIFVKSHYLDKDLIIDRNSFGFGRV